MANKKKKVIAYLHTHWDREWYREFEFFRLRFARVFNQVLSMLEKDLIPSFYLDGQVCVLLDYLELYPHKQEQIKKFISEKRLFIGPFYALIDEFLTDETVFKKNIEIGLKISKEFGCEDFVGYFADTFGHSQNISKILKEYNIDKAVFWRGVGDLPADFIFNGINSVNLVRGYFMDIFSSDNSIEQKAKLLKENLDLIAKKSSNILLLPIGADHLGIPNDIATQVAKVNEILDDYDIILGSLFDYFNTAKFKTKFSGELRDNSKTFILPGVYSTRINLKQYNTECTYKLDLANKVQEYFGGEYRTSIEYAYKLLLKNQAHDSICGCSTDDVTYETISRYKKILQIADTIIEEIRFQHGDNTAISFEFPNKYKILESKTTNPNKNCQIIGKSFNFPSNILYDTNKIPVTEDYTTVYNTLTELNATNDETDIICTDNTLGNKNIRIEVTPEGISLFEKKKCHKNLIEFVRCKDYGDSYNFAPNPVDDTETAIIKSSKILYNGPFQASIRIETSFFPIDVSINKKSMLLNFRIRWNNLFKNRLWQVKFNLDKQIKETQSEDLNCLIKRKFNPKYDIRQNLPQDKGLEAKTNTAPMQRFLWAEGLGVITKGLNEYEVFDNQLKITLLRSIGIISNPNNPARTTPAGPPLDIPGAQMLGVNTAEFSIGFIDPKMWNEYVEEVYPQTIIL